MNRPEHVDPHLWHRLHPLSPVLRLGRAVPVLAFVAIESVTHTGADGTGRLVDLAVAAVGVLAAVVAWLVTRWRVEAGDLRIETGLITRSSKRFPLARLQAVDIVRPLLGRILGLAELRLRIAGGGRSSARLAYLSEAQAEELRLQLLELAARAQTAARAGGGPGAAADGGAGVGAGAGAGAAADVGLAAGAGPGAGTWGPPLVTVPLGRLVASVVISAPTLVALALIVAVLLIRNAAPGSTPLLVAVLVSDLIGTGRTLWRRINSGYAFSLRPVPDGVQVSGGMLATRTETIPVGRIQGVRITEPLLWRPFGWCRMEVDVAGGRQNRDEGGNRTVDTLLPVGQRAEAGRLLELVLPGSRPQPIRPPVRAKWKSPLRYRHLAAGCTDGFVVTGSGRFARITDVVPLAKVQSLRRVQGPLQRRLRLATVHVDVAGRSVYASFRDRDEAEAQQVLERLSRLCRTARATGSQR